MKRKNLYRLIFVLFVLVPFIIYHFSVSAEPLLGDSPPEDGMSDIEVVSPYLAIVQSTLPDGTEMVGYRINGPPEPEGSSLVFHRLIGCLAVQLYQAQ